MRNRKLGRTGPEISAIGLGCVGMTSSYEPPAARAEGGHFWRRWWIAERRSTATFGRVA
jgi:aryl-alcohol dehydrogenase-like predicted oxidoreductase